MKRLVIACLVLLVLPGQWLVSGQDNSSNTVHVVQPGENLFRIALNYGLTTDQITAANDILDPTRILAGQSLVIPGSTTAATVEVVVAPNADAASLPQQPGANLSIESALPEQPAIANNLTATEPLYHTISPGQTLRTIAAQYGTTEAELITLNGLANPNRILAGQQLLIRNEVIEVNNTPVTEAVAISESGAGDPAADAGPEPIIHTVQQGEYISAIARRYGVNSNIISAANNLADPDRLLVGQSLIIPNGADTAAISALLYPEPGPVVKLGREIVVDLSNSRVYAYENGILMYEAVSSNGLPATPTVQGNFTVRSKVRSQTMSGPGYWLPNVEWVLYFYQGYALHGAYWHNNFGQPMSHGCVNLTNTDARWFYDFAEIGTPVTVQF
jgi:LysM repeat protein